MLPSEATLILQNMSVPATSKRQIFCGKPAFRHTLSIGIEAHCRLHCDNHSDDITKPRVLPWALLPHILGNSFLSRCPPQLSPISIASGIFSRNCEHVPELDLFFPRLHLYLTQANVSLYTKKEKTRTGKQLFMANFLPSMSSYF